MAFGEFPHLLPAEAHLNIYAITDPHNNGTKPDSPAGIVWRMAKRGKMRLNGCVQLILLWYSPVPPTFPGHAWDSYYPDGKSGFW